MPSTREAPPNTSEEMSVRFHCAQVRHCAVGVGIDTSRYGHNAAFLREDCQPAAPSWPSPKTPAATTSSANASHASPNATTTAPSPSASTSPASTPFAGPSFSS